MRSNSERHIIKLKEEKNIERIEDKEKIPYTDPICFRSSPVAILMLSVHLQSYL